MAPNAPFLSFGSGTERPEGEYPLPAGTHTVKLASLKYVAKVQKIVAEFKAADGLGYFTEWLGLASEGQLKRLGAFTGHLADLCKVARPSVFADPTEFDRFGNALVATDNELTLKLVEDVWEGKTRQVLAGKFDEAITTEVPF